MHFSDVAGVDEAVEEMQEIKDFSHYRANMLLPPAVYLARG